jgi:hypothetical protein
MTLRDPSAFPLPIAWRAAIRFCPYCSGTGQRDKKPDESCLQCQGTGNLLGMMLLDSWRAGAEHVIARVREMDSVRQEARRVAVERVREGEPTIEQLMRAQGL